MLLGASVTSTIKGKIIDTDLYADEPGVLLSETSDWKHRLWPVIPEYDSSDDYGGMGSDGCC